MSEWFWIWCVCVCVSTVRCLGGLSGGMLLGMTLEELKTVCPEEGRRVFYQLQNVKSALAVSMNEQTHSFFPHSYSLLTAVYLFLSLARQRSESAELSAKGE